jgi:hypothetical protein
VLLALARDQVERLCDKSFQDGFNKGLEDGRSEGFKMGFDEGRLVYLVADATPPERKQLDTGLYGPSTFPAKSVEVEMRKAVSVAVSSGVVRAPTDEQWQMILADHPATCISAGAGSGKSTTLVLRVVFMLEYLGISDEDLTIISFTRASCEELRVSLRRVLSHWRGKPVSKEWAERRVRTFHSVLCGLAATSLPGRKFFDFIGGQSEADLQSGEEDVDNPMTSSRLNDKQAELLVSAYGSLFRRDPDFRADIISILRAELSVVRPQVSGKELKPGRFFYAEKRDSAVIRMVQSLWQADGWPFSGVRAELTPIPASLCGRVLFANGVEEGTGIPILLGLPPSAEEQQRVALVSAEGVDDVPLAQAVAEKYKIISRYAEKPYILIQSESDLKNFLLRQKHLRPAASLDGDFDAPVFPLRLQGEMKEVLIYEALFTQGSFIETLGTEVNQLIGAMPAPQVMDVNAHFLRALSRFWPHLRSEMESQRLHTFNQAFLTLTSMAETARFDLARLGRLRHLLVDEFQDISPQIASWLKAMQRRILVENPSKPVSIMAIGDDWQSIYGWRGSAPQLFIKFAEYFPAHRALGPARELVLTANFRSVPPVVRDAERLIAKVRAKVEKTCFPQVEQLPGDHGVSLQQYAPKDGYLSNDAEVAHLQSEISLHYRSAVAMKSKSAEKVIVMTRSRALSQRLVKAMPASRFPGMRICTYHQAKGLEADVAVMVGDCAPGESHPLRNMFYAASGMYVGYSYDDASADEALRLAYVGVTRARRRVVWQVRKATPGGTAVVYAAEAK